VAHIYCQFEYENNQGSYRARLYSACSTNIALEQIGQRMLKEIHFEYAYCSSGMIYLQQISKYHS
jgi:hypothetical protein